MGRLRNATVLSVVIAVSCSQPTQAPTDFTVIEATIPEIQTLMESGELTSRELVTLYLMRIARAEIPLPHHGGN